VKYFEIQLVGDPARARATVQQALEARNFRVIPADDWRAVAERGSKVGNLLAGAFAQYMKIDISIHSVPGSDASLVRLSRGNSGAMGGAIGVARTNKNMVTLFTELQETFGSAGVLQDAQGFKK